MSMSSATVWASAFVVLLLATPASSQGSASAAAEPERPVPYLLSFAGPRGEIDRVGYVYTAKLIARIQAWRMRHGTENGSQPQGSSTKPLVHIAFTNFKPPSPTQLAASAPIGNLEAILIPHGAFIAQQTERRHGVPFPKGEPALKVLTNRADIMAIDEGLLERDVIAVAVFPESALKPGLDVVLYQLARDSNGDVGYHNRRGAITEASRREWQ